MFLLQAVPMASNRTLTFRFSPAGSAGMACGQRTNGKQRISKPAPLRPVFLSIG